jgi:hypothetical protein
LQQPLICSTGHSQTAANDYRQNDTGQPYLKNYHFVGHGPLVQLVIHAEKVMQDHLGHINGSDISWTYCS